MGAAPGEEFRAAARAADRVGAQVVLGDRPIEVTLGRAWEALPGGKRGRLVSELLRAGLTSKTFEVRGLLAGSGRWVEAAEGSKSAVELQHLRGGGHCWQAVTHCVCLVRAPEGCGASAAGAACSFQELKGFLLD